MVDDHSGCLVLIMGIGCGSKRYFLQRANLEASVEIRKSLHGGLHFQDHLELCGLCGFLMHQGNTEVLGGAWQVIRQDVPGVKFFSQGVSYVFQFIHTFR